MVVLTQLNYLVRAFHGHVGVNLLEDVDLIRVDEPVLFSVDLIEGDDWLLWLGRVHWFFLLQHVPELFQQHRWHLI